MPKFLAFVALDDFLKFIYSEKAAQFCEILPFTNCHVCVEKKEEEGCKYWDEIAEETFLECFNECSDVILNFHKNKQRQLPQLLQ